MKLKSYLFALLLSTSALVFTACGNANSENSLNDTSIIEVSSTTQIEGSLPPVMNFYEVDLQEDGQTVSNVSEAMFYITEEKGQYWAKWSYEKVEEAEKIQFLTEKTPGLAYEIKTESSNGTTTYLINKVDEEGVWVMTNNNNNHHGYLCDIATADQHKNDNL